MRGGGDDDIACHNRLTRCQVKLLLSTLEAQVAARRRVVLPLHIVAARIGNRDGAGGRRAAVGGRVAIGKARATPLFLNPCAASPVVQDADAVLQVGILLASGQFVGNPAAHTRRAGLHACAVVIANALEVEVGVWVVDVGIHIGEADFVLEQIAHGVACARAREDAVKAVEELDVGQARRAHRPHTVGILAVVHGGQACECKAVDDVLVDNIRLAQAVMLGAPRRIIVDANEDGVAFERCRVRHGQPREGGLVGGRGCRGGRNACGRGPGRIRCRDDDHGGFGGSRCRRGAGSHAGACAAQQSDCNQGGDEKTVRVHQDGFQG